MISVRRIGIMVPSSGCTAPMLHVKILFKWRWYRMHYNRSWPPIQLQVSWRSFTHDKKHQQSQNHMVPAFVQHRRKESLSWIERWPCQKKKASFPWALAIPGSALVSMMDRCICRHGFVVHQGWCFRVRGGISISPPIGWEAKSWMVPSGAFDVACTQKNPFHME